MHGLYFACKHFECFYYILNFAEKAINAQKEMEATKRELYEAHLEIIDYKNELTKQNEVIAKIEVL